MGTMLVTTFLTFFVIRYGWGYPMWLCVLAEVCWIFMRGT
jgi:KUP system potassium uptake protein